MNELTKSPQALGIVPGEQQDGMSGSVTASEQTRAMQEVQASIICAMKYPRSEEVCRDSIINACKRQGLAEVAQYVYPKGGTKVTGPSIRLLEESARLWGHIAYGWRIIQETAKGATVQTYAWDMQANIRTTIEFYVEYLWKSNNQYKRIEDPREQYEHVANMSARRVRACLQKIVPAYVIDEAIDQCDRTLNATATVDSKKLLEEFGKFGVNQAMIEKRIGHNLDVLNQQEYINLRKVYSTIRDGFSPVSQHFDVPETVETKKSVGLTPKKSTQKDPEPAPTVLPPADKKKEEPPAEPKPPEDDEETKKAQESLGLGDLT